MGKTVAPAVSVPDKAQLSDEEQKAALEIGGTTGAISGRGPPEQKRHSQQGAAQTKIQNKPADLEVGPVG